MKSQPGWLLKPSLFRTPCPPLGEKVSFDYETCLYLGRARIAKRIGLGCRISNQEIRAQIWCPLAINTSSPAYGNYYATTKLQQIQ